MRDYTWPSVFFAYFFFALSLAVGLYFLIRSRKDGYWSKEGENVKYRVFEDELVGQGGNLRADCQPAPPAGRSHKNATQ